MHRIPLDELNKIPYANVDSLGDRKFILMPLWDGEYWRQWIPNEAGNLIEIKVVDLVRSNYVSKKAASQDDLWIPFVDFMWQRANWPEIYPYISTLCDCFHKIGTSLEKINHFFQHEEIIRNDSLTPFVNTELEYIIIMTRSVFDLLQEAISKIWNGRIQLLDSDAHSLKIGRAMPGSFSKLILREKFIFRSSGELVEKYALPEDIAEVYLKNAEFFSALRDTRDNIVHGLSNNPTVFTTERGFCVAPKDKAFYRFDIWKKQHYYNENIASLYPWLSYVVFNTVGACSEIMEAYAKVIKFPDEIAPGYRVYLRDHSSNAFLDLLKVHREEKIWWERRNA